MATTEYPKESEVMRVNYQISPPQPYRTSSFPVNQTKKNEFNSENQNDNQPANEKKNNGSTVIIAKRKAFSCFSFK